jgi:ATP-dependent Clp protease ATP-binding subunit ClpX
MPKAVSAHIRQFLSQTPHYTPAEMVQRLDACGYKGQEQAKKALSLMAYRHLNRLKRLYLDGVSRHDLPPKENFLLVGPTGSGKTFLVELLFRTVLHLPTVIVDITSYSETGYVGQDAVSMLTRLMRASQDDPELASIGVICIDEFDKLSSGKNNAVFSGQGTTKDVSGLGVQRELLKMLEESDVDVPTELSHSSYARRETFGTGDIAFIACGAFSGLSKISRKYAKSSQKGIGFGQKGEAEAAEKKEAPKTIAVSLNRNDLAKVTTFEKYGILPELIGRFSRIVPFEALDKDTLKDILRQTTLKKYEKELALHDVKLEIDEAVCDRIVADALKRETGARGIRYALLEFIEDALFEMYSTDRRVNKIFLRLKEDEIKWKLSYKRK